ncbi:MAG: RAMP superfamily CRISPR-associated protein [Clostridiales bacterium]|nr:RAMP superfamily CRISPR-associated protein [Clostridiales bacterium]
MGKNVVPYNFVPLGRGKTRVAPVDPTNLKLLKGKICCTLEVKTPIFIPNTTGDAFFGDRKERIRAFFSYDIFTSQPVQVNHAPKKPIIPGSSLRGALRSVFEAASNSCLRVTDKDYWKHVPQDYLPCTGLKSGNRYDLCPACSLFGMIGGEKDGISYAGRLRVSDAVPVNKVTYTWRRIPQQYGPKKAMCLDREGCHTVERNQYKLIKGRKFYWHHPPKEEPNSSGDLAQTIDPGAIFQFDIHFDGVTEMELKRVVAIICLNGNAHKIGEAKPLGFGSVEMRVNRIVQHQAVFDGENGRIVLDRRDVTKYYQAVTMEDSFGTEDNHLDELMGILCFDAVIWPNYIDIQYRPPRYSPGNGQQFIDGSINEIVSEINRQKVEAAQIEEEQLAELREKMKETASDEEWKGLAAKINKRRR